MDTEAPGKENRELRAEALAKDIMYLSRNILLVNFRFLDRALSSLKMQYSRDVSICTDGEYIYYGPWYILSLYKNERNAVARDLLHSVLHCVFRHWYAGGGIDRVRWDLASDIAVENAINGFGGSTVWAERQGRQSALTGVLESETGTLTAERIYNWLGKQNFTEDELRRERENFIGDGHGVWYGEHDPDAGRKKDVNLRKIWEDVSKRMQTELETIRRDRESSLVQNLRSLNRTRKSYTDFLRRFGVHGEVMRLSDEEFDNNYYSYGMELYGNIPLIEPLEYSEQKRIREFAIAIDTSGSVRGDVVQSFVQHTYDILMKRESFFTKVNIYIIQCDDRIEHAARISSPRDFEDYIRNLEIRGLGRTDFRPVFEYVNGLLAKKELTDFRGLLYFTDGRGVFPAECPPYDTAFVIHSDGCADPEIPSWAQSLTVSEEDILDRRFSSC